MNIPKMGIYEHTIHIGTAVYLAYAVVAMSFSGPGNLSEFDKVSATNAGARSPASNETSLAGTWIGTIDQPESNSTFQVSLKISGADDKFEIIDDIHDARDKGRLRGHGFFDGQKLNITENETIEFGAIYTWYHKKMTLEPKNDRLVGTWSYCQNSTCEKGTVSLKRQGPARSTASVQQKSRWVGKTTQPKTNQEWGMTLELSGDGENFVTTDYITGNNDKGTVAGTAVLTGNRLEITETQVTQQGSYNFWVPTKMSLKMEGNRLIGKWKFCGDAGTGCEEGGVELEKQ